METSQLKNSIDNESNSPQYLVVESLPLLQLGIDFEMRAPFQGKNCSRRKLHASKEKGCQEKETLTVRETILRTSRNSEKPLERSTSPGVFYLIPGPKAQKRAVAGNEGLSRTPGRARNADRGVRRSLRCKPLLQPR